MPPTPDRQFGRELATEEEVEAKIASTPHGIDGFVLGPWIARRTEAAGHGSLLQRKGNYQRPTLILARRETGL
jgi:hypothetical protein